MGKPDNSIRYRSPSGISSTNGETIKQPGVPNTTNNSPIITSRPAYAQSNRDEEANLADNPQANSILDQMLGIIQGIWANTGGAVVEALGCPDQVFKRRGWKIDSEGVRFAPCGCYVDAMWPHILGLGAAAGAAKSVLTKLLRKRFLRTQALIFSSRYARQILGRVNESLGHLQKGITIGGAFKNRKMPPVAPGFKRLYRGVGNKTRAQCDGTLPTLQGTDGRFWTDDIRYAEGYSRDRDTGEFTELSHIYYVDIPEADYNRYQLDGFFDMEGMDRQVWLRTTNKVPTNSGGNPIDLGPLSQFETVEGQWFLNNKEFPSIRIQDGSLNFWTQSPMGNRWKEKQMPLIREINGVKHIVLDFLTTEDRRLNPHLFPADKISGLHEWFLPESLINDKKVAAFIDTEAQNTLSCGVKPLSDVLNSMKGNEEKFLSDVSFREQWLQSFREAHEKWEETKDFMNENFELTKTFLRRESGNGNQLIVADTPEIRESFDALDSIITESYTSIVENTGWFLTFLNTFLAVWIAIEAIMNFTTIVEDKKCNTTMLGVSLDGGPIDDHYIGTLSATDQFRLHAIRQKLPVPAMMDPDTCECNVCPDLYQLCDKSSLTNLWDDRRNMCFPECCGGKQLQPISLTKDCACECPEGYSFQECKRSDCLSHVNSPSYIMYWLTGNWEGFGKKPFYGSCFPNNPNPNKLVWDPNSCSYVCDTYQTIRPAILMGGYTRVPVEPCKDGSIRKPPACECLPPPSPPPAGNLKYVYNEDTDRWETVD